MGKAEGEIQKTILSYLEDDLGWPLVIRCNSGTVKMGGRFLRLAKKGTPDIVACCPHGTFVAFEVKTETGAATHEQEQVIARVRASGAHGAVVRSLPEVERCIKTWCGDHQ